MGSESIVRMIPTNCNCRHSGCERHHFGEQYYLRISFDRIGWVSAVRSQESLTVNEWDCLLFGERHADHIIGAFVRLVDRGPGYRNEQVKRDI